ncbi:MAG: FUSC family protein [Oscillospiraceae bacterium]|nr:FUSC family protein [Oscillospiraceae bacterium]
MAKTRLINNAIALAVYAAIIAFLNYGYVLIPRALDPEVLVAVLGAIILLGCGFFLKPVEKRSFLSVLSPLAASVLVFICFMFLDGDDAFGYFAFNPFTLGALMMGEIVGEWGYTITVLLSPAIPSLLLYAGVLLRKLWANKKHGRIYVSVISVAVAAVSVVALVLNCNANSLRTKFVSETPDMWFMQTDPLEDFTTGQLMLNGQPVELVVYSGKEYPPTMTFADKSNEYEKKFTCTYYYTTYPEEVLTIYIDRESDTLLDGQYKTITFTAVKFKP